MRPIEEIFVNGISIGFRCRRSVMFGIVQEIPDGWSVGVREGSKLAFSGNYRTRKEAKQALHEYSLNVVKVDNNPSGTA